MKFSGVTILQGVEFSIFPIDFEWALQQCSATALPVISNMFTIHCSHVGDNFFSCFSFHPPVDNNCMY